MWSLSFFLFCNIVAAKAACIQPEFVNLEVQCLKTMNTKAIGEEFKKYKLDTLPKEQQDKVLDYFFKAKLLECVEKNAEV